MLRKPYSMVLAILLCGCSMQPYQKTFIPYPATSTFTVTNTNTIPYTPIPLFTPSITPVQYIKINSLPPGEYITSNTDFISSPTNEEFIYFSVYSPQGDFKGYLMRVNNSDARFSPDLRYLLDEPYIIDMNSGEKIFVQELGSCGGMYWAPDSKRLVMGCPINDALSQIPLEDTNNIPNVVSSLFVYSLEDHSMHRITNNIYPIALVNPSWSPDGKWIAYGEEVLNSPSNHFGLHIIDTKCLSSSTPCWRDEIGTDLDGPFTWSPDSQFVAGIYQRIINDKDIFEVRVYKINNGLPLLSSKYPIGAQMYLIAWSPDGKQIAVSTRDGNYLLSVATGKLVPLNINFFYDWIEVP